MSGGKREEAAPGVKWGRDVHSGPLCPSLPPGPHQHLGGGMTPTGSRQEARVAFNHNHAVGLSQLCQGFVTSTGDEEELLLHLPEAQTGQGDPSAGRC